jgi:hypothetical protein
MVVDLWSYLSYKNIIFKWYYYWFFEVLLLVPTPLVTYPYLLPENPDVLTPPNIPDLYV